MNYSGTQFQQFWSRCGEGNIHPDDIPFFDAEKALEGKVVAGRTRMAANFETEQYLPCPFDGPLDTAKVVVCLANPNYPKTGGDFREVILRQRTGKAPLPEEWDSTYYKKIAKSLKLDVNQIRELVCLFNVCPYPSNTMEGAEKRLAAGLPSVWAAQRHLREVLIPEAKKGNIHLVVIRKHELWGITDGFMSPNIAVIRGLERPGTMPSELGDQIHTWLAAKGFIGQERH